MKLFSIDNWLRAPADHDTIRRWTVGGEQPATHELSFPQPQDPDRFQFLALGDTGDSAAAGQRVSPQDAVAREMALDVAPAGESGGARLIAHVGDVVYMTGEHRLYDRNFRLPYSNFLTPESTIDNLIFQIPFLPVPGNHDYYDLGGWARWLSRVPVLGAGIRALSHELFAFSIPEGGSDAGRAYMDAFVDLSANTSTEPLAYRPGERTRLPNRYYRFRAGSVDFFALDSNTLESPAPGTDPDRVRQDAGQRVERLEQQAHSLEEQLRSDQLALERWHQEQRRTLAADPARLAAIHVPTDRVERALQRVTEALEGLQANRTQPCDQTAASQMASALSRWRSTAERLARAKDPSEAVERLEDLESVTNEVCRALQSLEASLGSLAEGSDRSRLLTSRAEVEEALHSWAEEVAPAPADLCAHLHELAEDALDVQRELALEHRRARYQPEDYDAVQLEWLDRSLEEAIQERPDGWRVLYLHHPLYTSIRNHCERPDVRGLRENLLSRIRDKVHLVLSGHSHAFEWFRSDAMPHTGLFVTGGGGQMTLRRSLMDPRRWRISQDRYEALRRGGVQEAAVAGRGPAGEDGAGGLLYHYLKVDVTPEALLVRPVGVRRLDEGYRREEPMPVFYVPEMPAGRPPWQTRRLTAVEIRRETPPRPVWAD